MRIANTSAKFPQAPRTRQAVVAGVPDDLGVKREIRLALFEKAIDRLLSDGENRDFVIFEMRGSPNSYVQYMLHDGAVLGEVGSRGWIAEGELLDKERVTALGCVGFEEAACWPTSPAITSPKMLAGLPASQSFCSGPPTDRHQTSTLRS